MVLKVAMIYPDILDVFAYSNLSVASGTYKFQVVENYIPYRNAGIGSPSADNESFSGNNNISASAINSFVGQWE